MLAPDASATEYGGCRFDSRTLRFAGTVAETTSCLLKKVRPKGSGADAQEVPAWLRERVARPFPYKNEHIQAFLDSKGIALAELSDRLLSDDSPTVRYFVIHDTSWPEFEHPVTEFPSDINNSEWSGNSLNGWPSISNRVNLLISRDGRSRVLRPWGSSRSLPATKLEQRSNVFAARPLFVHVENIQPRIKPEGSFAWRAPEPGLGPRQEERLALAYVIASFHAGRWLIPAYHFNIDQGFADVHDDPQNMDLQSWADKLNEIDAALSATDIPA